MNSLLQKIFFLTLINLSFSYIPTTITGYVYDINNNPIDNVLIISEIDQTYSKDDGSFTMLYKSNESIKFTRIGYQEEIIKPNYFKTKNIVVLKQNAVFLDEILISELTGEIKLHESSQDIHIFSTKDLENSDSHFQNIIDKIHNFNFSGAS